MGLWKRIRWCAFFIALYILGSNLPLPFFAPSDLAQQDRGGIFLLTSMFGGKLFQMTWFSLGFGPYMSAMIVWRFVIMSSAREERRYTAKETDRLRKLLILGIGVIQSIGLLGLHTKDLRLPAGFSPWVVYVFTVLFLLCGTCMVVWLGDCNDEKGIGGLQAFLVTGLVQNVFQNLLKIGIEVHQSAPDTDIVFLIALLITAAVVYVLTIALDPVEYRIPLVHVNLDRSLQEDSYLPIPWNPAGIMPVMFSFTLFSLPLYLLEAFRFFQPDNTIVLFLQEMLSLTTPWGLLLYLLLLVVMTFGFGMMQVDPTKTAERMQKSGDYLLGHHPGKETERYLTHVGRISCALGSLFLLVFSGLPLVLGIFYPQWASFSMLPSQVMMSTSILFLLVQQAEVFRMERKYHPLFELE